MRCHCRQWGWEEETQRGTADDGRRDCESGADECGVGDEQPELLGLLVWAFQPSNPYRFPLSHMIPLLLFIGPPVAFFCVFSPL